METWAQVLIALTIIMEARGQPDLGKAMVADVVMNRSRALAIEYSSVEMALYEGQAFAVWGPDLYGPGHSLRQAVLECFAMGVLPYDPWCIERWMDARAPEWGRRLKIGSGVYWSEVWTIAVDAYEGRWSPPPELAGKRHFDNPMFWPEGLPPWLQNCVEVADHVFCD